MCLYGVYSDFADDLHANSDCVGVKRYIRRKWVQKKYLSHINTYQSTRNFTLNPNLRSKKIFRPRIFEKIRFEKFAKAYLKNFDFTELELKFEVI